MAFIHHTTLTPGKLELLAAWLPGRPWYAGTATGLERAGGFRLDDPAGEVGIEVLFVADGDGIYQVPLSYRAAAVEGAQDALVGESEHGVLGHRWVYDGVHDQVAVAQLLALAAGEVEAQAQSVSHTPDPTVRPSPRPPGPLAAATPLVASAPLVVRDDESGLTTVALREPGLELVVVRTLGAQVAGDVVGAVEADVPQPAGGTARRVVVAVRRVDAAVAGP